MSEKVTIHVPHELFAPAESSYFSGRYNLSTLQAGPDTYIFDDPLDWEVTLTNTGGALLVSGSIKGVAKTSCARCIEDFSFPIKGEVEGFYLLSEEEEAPEDMDDDEFDVLSKDNIIDLEPLLDAALLIEVPLIPLCNEECKGLCVTCGANLNEEKCTCGPQETGETETVKPNPFAALKDYPFDPEP